MKIYRSLEDVPQDFGPSALTIGNFDGVHYGHRRILRRLKALADANGWKPSVLTFDPHPTRVVAPDRTPPLLTAPEERAELMREEGIEQVLILPFTPEVAHLSPADFVTRLVVGALGARAVLVGDNFRYGYRHAGDVTLLAQLGKKLGFATEMVPAVSCRGRVVSSSGIRDLIRSGRVELAARFLLHPYAVEGRVVPGRGIGSKQTVPTLNLATESEVLPAPGVYITRTRDLEGPGEWNSITNIGYRPTFGQSSELSIETFLLDALAGAPPARIRVCFLKRVREERRFDTPEALRGQILKDAAAAQRYFRRAKAWTGRACISC
ncbi:MAG TPA: bifunctional riboflavin kinase/FAD synthetase [Candidatus Acidoferrales bacterium]|nr:bifunctional riboflavin kinase/FAD synthetase [Candidatus Acidoferrales bacterium]